jgi:hypothetical protein
MMRQRPKINPQEQLKKEKKKFEKKKNRIR